MSKTCNKCGFEGSVDKFYSKTCCKNCHNEYNRMWRNVNRDKDKEYGRNAYYRHGGKSMLDNKDCTLFLGIHVAERVLSHAFKEVEKMPHCNRGFDFICNRGKKIDVKSSCLQHPKKAPPCWSFHICKNTIADFFLCLAFDNRIDLNPLYVWLLPGIEVNHLVSTRISTNTIDRWDQYVIDINKVKSCCDIMKE